MSFSASDVSGGLGAASAGVKAAGSLVKGSAEAQTSMAQAQIADYQAQVARNNQTIANQNADYEIKVGQQRASTQSMMGGAQIGAIKARQGASGIDVNSGSAVDVQGSQREINKLDSETMLNNYQLAAYGYRTQATNFGAQAGLDTAQGNLYRSAVGSAQTGGFLDAIGGLLQSASSMPTSWLSGLTGGGGAAGSGIPGGAAGLGSGGALFGSSAAGATGAAAAGGSSAAAGAGAFASIDELLPLLAVAAA